MPSRQEVLEILRRHRRGGRPEWTPVKLLQVDVNQVVSDVSFEVLPGQRVWIEAIKAGQVVGLAEVNGDENGLRRSVIESVIAPFVEATATPFTEVPDQLLPMASVVVPTVCQNLPRLQSVVAALMKLDYPDFEIVVVDNRHDPHGAPLPQFESNRPIRIEREFKRGASAARNRGVSVAKGEFIAFTDDDALVDVQWLRALGARFVLSPEVEGIGGLVLPKELRTEPQLWFEEFYGDFNRSFTTQIVSLKSMDGSDKLSPYATGRFGAGNNMAFRRESIARIHGFNESLGPGTPAKGGEDLAIFFELLDSGGILATEPAAVVRHYNRETQGEFLRQVFRYGTGLMAMYTAVSARHPRRVIPIIRRIPAGLRRLSQHHELLSPSSPRRTLAYQVLGMTYGPVAYGYSAIRNFLVS